MRESRKQSTYYGPRILGYQALWLLGLLLGLIFAGPLTNLISGTGQVTGPALLNIYPIINTMLWGGIGGIVGALYTLWWHISRRAGLRPQLPDVVHGSAADGPGARGASSS